MSIRKSTILFGLIIFVSGCTTTAVPLEQLPDEKSYPGVIESFSNPIAIRYSEVKSASINKIDQAVTYRGTQNQKVSANILWGYRIEKTLGFMDHIYELKNVRTRGNDSTGLLKKYQNVKKLFESSKIIITTDEFGKTHNVSGKGPNFDKLNQKNRQKVFDRLEEVFSLFMSRLPTTPVRMEQVFLNWTAFDTSKGKRTDLSLKGIAKGMTRYNGRDALVFAVEGELRGAVIPIPVGGYGIIDLKSGVILYMETHASASDTQKTIELQTSYNIKIVE